MKNILVSAILVFFVSVLFGQLPFEKISGNSNQQIAVGITADSTNSTVVVIGTTSKPSGVLDILLQTYTVTGVLNDEYTISGDLTDQATKIHRSKDNNYLVVGQTENGANGPSDAWIAKISGEDLSIIWQKNIGGNDEDAFYDVCEHFNPDLNSTSIVAVGYSKNGISQKDILYTELDQNGNLIRNRVYGGSQDDVATAIDTANATDFWVVGWSNSFDASSNGFAFKTDYDGTLFSFQTFNTGNNDYILECFVDESGTETVHLVGHSIKNSGVQVALQTAIREGQTLPVYTKLFPESRSISSLTSIHESKFQSWILASGYETGDNNDLRALHFRTDFSGNNEGSKYVDACGGDEVFNFLIEINQDEYFAVGYTNSYGEGKKDLLISGQSHENTTTSCVLYPMYNDQPENVIATVTTENMNQTTATISVSDGLLTRTSTSLVNQDICANASTICQTEINIIDRTQLCGEGPAQLSVNNSCSSISWSTNETDSVIEVSVSGEYSVQVTKDDGCVAFDTISVNFTSNTLNPVIDTTHASCGDLILSLDQKYDSYSWSTNEKTDTIIINESDSVWVDVQLENCIARDSIIITISNSTLEDFNLINSKDWDPTTDLNYLIPITANKAYTLRVSGGFSDDGSATYSDALFDYNAASNTQSGPNTLQNTGSWFIEENTKLIPTSANYNNCHIYDFVICDLDTNLGVYFLPASYALNLGNMQFDLYESTFDLDTSSTSISTGINVSNGCTEDSVTFTSTGFYSNNYTWTFGDPSSGSADTSQLLVPKHLYADTGQYIVTLIGSNYCSNQDTIIDTLNIQTSISLSLEESYADCSNGFVTLDAQTGDSIEILWSNGETTSSTTFTSSDEVVLQASFGDCITYDTTNVYITPLSNELRATRWYFGQNAGLDFNTSPPTPLLDGNINTEEGSAVISDAQGNLLFYTDGVTVYTKNHTVMTNGNGLLGSSSATQSAIIIPKPASSSEYYVFSTPSWDSNTGLNYSIVDLSLQGGEGEVTDKNVNLFANSSEKITATPHANGTDTWVIAHSGNALSFYTLLITQAGIISNQQNIGLSIGGNQSVGQMKVSQQGDRIALASYSGRQIQVLDFDNNTGAISNPITANAEGSEFVYGLEFSPNGEYLYVSQEGANGRLYQYDVSKNTTTSTDFQLSAQLVDFQSGFGYGSLQLGPDNRIYIAKSILKNDSTLAVINNPDEVLANIQFENSGIELSGQLSSWGLPTFNQGYMESSGTIIELSGLTTDTICSYDTLRLSLDTNLAATNPVWLVDDETFGNSSFETQFETGGWKQIQLSFTDACGNNTSYTDSIFVSLIQALNFADSTLCSGTLTYTIDSSIYDNWSWSTGSTSNSILINQTNNYSITANVGTCSVSDTFQINFLTNNSFDKRLSNWHLGSGVSLTFDESSVTATTTSLTQLTHVSSVATNSEGELQFIVDGRDIFDRNFNKITSTQLSGSAFDLGTKLMTIPLENEEKYMVITYESANQTGLRYTIVNMSLNGGLGGVESQNSFFDNQASKMIGAIERKTGSYWVVTSSKNVSFFRVTEVSAAGTLGGTRIFSCGFTPTSTNVGHLSFSNDATKIAGTWYTDGKVVIADFDSTTGNISNPIVVDVTNPVTALFSPDDSHLIVSTKETSQDGINIFNLENLDASSISASRQLIFQFEDIGKISYTPNKDKIALTSWDNSFLMTIDDLSGDPYSWTVNQTGISLAGSTVRYGLPYFPHFLQSETAKIDIDDVCLGDSSTITLSGITSDLDLLFNGSDTLTLSSFTNKILIDTLGSFSMSALVPEECASEISLSDSFTVNAIPSPALQDTTLCSTTGYTIRLDGFDNHSYSWSTGSSSDSTIVYFPDSVSVTVTTDEGCSGSDTAYFDITGSTSIQQLHWQFGDNAAMNFTSGTPIISTGGTGNPNLTAVLTYKGIGYAFDGYNLLTQEGGAHFAMPAPFVGADQANLLIAPSEERDSIMMIYVNNSAQLKVDIVNIRDPKAQLSSSLTLNGNAEPKVTAYKDGDTTWVAFHLYGFSIFTFPVFEDFSIGDIIDNSASRQTEASNFGLMKFSPTGTHLVNVYNEEYAEVHTFDFATGKLNRIEVIYLDGVKGAEFSPDGSKLYLSTGRNETLFQYEIIDGSIVDNDGTRVPASSMDPMYHMQLGPDGKLYIAGYYDVHIIENPNDDANDIITQMDVIDLGGPTTAGGGLVTTMTHPITDQHKINVTNVCLGDTNEVIIETESEVLSWNVNETNTTFVDSSFSKRLKVQFDAVGQYSFDVTLAAKTCNASTTLKLSDTLNVYDYPTLNLSDTSNCGFGYLLKRIDKSPYDSVRWSTGNNCFGAIFTKTGTYSATVYKNGCPASDDFTASIGNIPGSSNYNPLSKRANNWYFGYNAGITFNTNPASSLTDGQLNSYEGTSCMSDTAGNLLFYTDGEKVWNRNHQIMSNGSDLLGGVSSTHSSIIIPHPNDDNLYYIFNTPSRELWMGGPEIGCHYSILDMSLNNGLGDITLTKNIQLFTPSSEKLAGVYHANGKDIWVVAHEVTDQGSNRFFTYLIDENGLNTTPIISETGSYYVLGSDTAKGSGQIKFTPQGDRLGVAIGGSSWELFDFNNKTGEISCPWKTQAVTRNAIGLEFSPSGQYMYGTDWQDNGIHQWDVWSDNYEDFLSSYVKFGTQSNGIGKKEGMQLGPDGKIYVNENLQGKTAVSVINNPDEKGSSANFVLDQLALENGNAVLRFPTFIASYFIPEYELIKPEITVDDFCIGSETRFTVTNNISINSWDFGDTLSGNNSSSAPLSASHTYSMVGNFTYLAKYIGGCEDTVIVKDSLTIFPYPDSTYIDTAICGSNITLNSPELGDSYIWSNSIANNIGTEDSITVTASDFYKLLLTTNGCTTESQYDVSLETMPTWTEANNYFICLEEGQTVTINPGSAYSAYDWDGEATANEPFTINTPGNYTLNLTGDSLCVEIQNIVVAEECDPIIHIPNTFSPNGNDLNEWFGPRTWYVNRIDFTIFNEWGEPVFHTTELEDYWDGTFNGEEAPSGAYAYICTYWAPDNGKEISNTITGNITLVR